MIVYIVLTIMGIFTVWSIIYTDHVKKERYKKAHIFKGSWSQTKKTGRIYPAFLVL